MIKRLRFLSDLLARFVNEIEYKIVMKKLKKQDLIADVDDQSCLLYTSDAADD